MEDGADQGDRPAALRALHDQVESYNFDKTECLSCQHNTANQVLFKDECTGGCAGCQNRECMLRKNDEFLVQKAVKLLKDDPRTTLATDGETPLCSTRSS